jgi:hypothetical protein
MTIHNQPKTTFVDSAAAASAGQAAGSRPLPPSPGTTPKSAVDVSGRFHQSELVEHLFQLQQIPEARADVVAAAREAVRSGELLSRAAAESSAEAFLSVR